MRALISSSPARPLLISVCASAALAGVARAQSFNNQWLVYADETGSRLAVATELGASDPQEKDYAWGDLDQNGFTDLVVVRKQPVTTAGKHPNVLMLNEGGVLTDRTSIFAIDADIPGDEGFLTPTNDRDVALADVDLNGWLDVITSPVLSFGDPKHISHPRVYVNKGASPGGGWLGLRFEDVRFPEYTTPSGDPTSPDFCGVNAGDLDLDGDADLYFTHYSSGTPAGYDINDKLMINAGQGFFVDESTLRVSSGMLDSGFGTAAFVLDMNMDGLNDIVKSENGPSDAAYSSLSAPGFYDVWDNIQGGAVYHVGVGDLNNDGRPDTVFSDDGTDNVRYNQGTDAVGRVIFGPTKAFSFLAGGDDGFGGNSLITDLDGDGWKDVLVTDVDVDVDGCGRRMHTYHNPGGTPGGQFTLLEEREDSGESGWTGAVGLHPSQLTGSHDVAAFDIDGDGDKDLVLGRCAGTSVYINQGVPHCQTDLGHDGAGTGRLRACGEVLSTGGVTTLQIDHVPPSTPIFLGVTKYSSPLNIPGLGTIVAFPPEILLQFRSTPYGEWQSGPIGGGSGPISVVVQALYLDTSQPLGLGLTNALRVYFAP